MSVRIHNFSEMNHSGSDSIYCCTYTTICNCAQMAGGTSQGGTSREVPILTQSASQQAHPAEALRHEAAKGTHPHRGGSEQPLPVTGAPITGAPSLPAVVARGRWTCV